MNSDLLNMVGNVGFPIAVSVYLLVRLESKLEVLTTSINNLSMVINNSSREK
ncbi:MAG: YvrJ family protein [Clostridiaceae bacterium]|nr:YvrJ family protein [Clostridiaceae bacterium]